jgi:hypothetical protein
VNLKTFRAFCALGITRLGPELKSAGAGREFSRLVGLGVREETLFSALLIFKLLPSLDHTLRALLGEMRDRRRKAKILRDAASVMDELAHMVEGEAGSMTGKLPPDQTIPTPLKTADALHVYANLLFIREQLLEALDANSAEEIAKYTLASAVHRITGKYHDREVSGITGAFLGKYEYDETAHRVWRIRAVRRLDKTCSLVPVMLHALNSALDSSS